MRLYTGVIEITFDKAVLYLYHIASHLILLSLENMQLPRASAVSRYTGLVGMEMSSACTVLVVEDEPIIRSHLATMLEDEGCKTYEASDAVEAIAIMEVNSEITVVFTDIQMPGTMDGIALARYVRKRWPPTIIVVSSGRAQPTAGVLAEDIPFLAKPYDNRRLSEINGHVRERLAAA